MLSSQVQLRRALTLLQTVNTSSHSQSFQDKYKFIFNGRFPGRHHCNYLSSPISKFILTMQKCCNFNWQNMGSRVAHLLNHLTLTSTLSQVHYYSILCTITDIKYRSNMCCNQPVLNTSINELWEMWCPNG